ncbi:hypothetical protein GALMADRAFT_217534 [Galerina marginata CBS 339.88]|uniref:Uncharacterized protein n=1 Tax=Galerina marginata (strain CBS 339.88) TaxID=685588 RepID=A0A067SCQ4_GALM3|nr:hypothetical protein GALMADRAFT_217534 [Galerina marginata CBS 339.88]
MTAIGVFLVWGFENSEASRGGEEENLEAVRSGPGRGCNVDGACAVDGQAQHANRSCTQAGWVNENIRSSSSSSRMLGVVGARRRQRNWGCKRRSYSADAMSSGALRACSAFLRQPYALRRPRIPSKLLLPPPPPPSSNHQRPQWTILTISTPIQPTPPHPTHALHSPLSRAKCSPQPSPAPPAPAAPAPPALAPAAPPPAPATPPSIPPIQYTAQTGGRPRPSKIQIPHPSRSSGRRVAVVVDRDDEDEADDRNVRSSSEFRAYAPIEFDVDHDGNEKTEHHTVQKTNTQSAHGTSSTGRRKRRRLPPADGGANTVENAESQTGPNRGSGRTASQRMMFSRSGGAGTGVEVVIT